MRTDLGIQTALDVDRLSISRHALERYVERRHGNGTSWAEADAAMRRMLRGCTTQRPAVFCAKGDPVRRYTASGFAFIVSADHSTLITVYPWRDRRRSHAGPRRRPRADDWLTEWEEGVA